MDKSNVAERLLNLADGVLHPHDLVLLANESKAEEPGTIARVVTAIKLKRADPALVLRAQFERWTLEQIVRELY